MNGGFGGCRKTEKVLAFLVGVVDWDMSARELLEVVVGSNQTPRGGALIQASGWRRCARLRGGSGPAPCGGAERWSVDEGGVRW